MRIARVIRVLWGASVVAALLAAAASIRWLGPHIGVLAAALLGVFAVYAMHPLVVAWNFALSRWQGDHVTHDLRIAPARFVAMVDAEIDASVRGLWVATPFLSERPAPSPDASLAPRTHALLFVHGYFCNRAIWAPFMRDAAARGYVCEAVTLDDVFAPIESHATTIAAGVAALLERAARLDRGARRVVVIAHSMGGLAVRAAATSIDTRAIAHVVTLGTPHAGTWPARFGRFASVVQMRRGSAWLAALADEERAGAGWSPTDSTTLYSAHDEIVYPQTTALLDGARHVRLSGIGHVALAYDLRVRDAVFERLEALALAEPRETDVATQAAT